MSDNTKQVEKKIPSWKTSLENELKIFEFTDVLPASEIEIKYKPINTKLTKKLLTYEKASSQEDQEEALDILIKETLLTPLDVDDFYLNDRFYFLLSLRKNSKGSDYTIKDKCPECKSQFMQNISLDEFEVKRIDKSTFDPVVKVTNKTYLELDMLTRRHQREVFKKYGPVKVQSKDETLQRVNQALALLAQTIKSITIDGQTDSDITLDDKIELVNMLPASVVEKISNWQKEHDYGYQDVSLTMVCPHCGNYKKTIDVQFADVFK